MDIRDEVFVVGHDCHVELVTTDKEEADRVCSKKNGEAPYLPWAVRSVENAIIHAFGAGLHDGEMNR